MTSDTLERDALLQRLRELAPWHMDMPLPHGLRTVDGNDGHYRDEDLNGVQVVDPELMRTLFDRLYPQGLQGRRFLDVGCNGGGYCFLAGQLGASACYGFDVRQHWIKQAQLLHETAYQGDPKYAFSCHHINDLSPSKHYDITLFKGVFYHLPDPISSLAQLCDVTEELIIVDTAGIADKTGDSLTAVFESKTKVMSGVDGLSWLPGGPAVIRKILAWKGFAHFRVIENKPMRHNRIRMTVVGARSETSLQYLLEAKAAAATPAPAQTPG